MLFSMPGVPSIYYGSEWGITGDAKRAQRQRPAPRHPRGSAAPARNRPGSFHPALIHLRQNNSLPCRLAIYQQLLVHNTHLAFRRNWEQTICGGSSQRGLKTRFNCKSQLKLDPNGRICWIPTQNTTGSNSPLLIELAANSARILARKH